MTEEYCKCENPDYYYGGCNRCGLNIQSMTQKTEMEKIQNEAELKYPNTRLPVSTSSQRQYNYVEEEKRKAYILGASTRIKLVEEIERLRGESSVLKQTINSLIENPIETDNYGTKQKTTGGIKE